MHVLQNRMSVIGFIGSGKTDASAQAREALSTGLLIGWLPKSAIKTFPSGPVWPAHPCAILAIEQIAAASGLFNQRR